MSSLWNVSNMSTVLQSHSRLPPSVLLLLLLLPRPLPLLLLLLLRLLIILCDHKGADQRFGQDCRRT